MVVFVEVRVVLSLTVAESLSWSLSLEVLFWIWWETTLLCDEFESLLSEQDFGALPLEAIWYFAWIC